MSGYCTILTFSYTSRMTESVIYPFALNYLCNVSVPFHVVTYVLPVTHNSTRPSHNFES